MAAKYYQKTKKCYKEKHAKSIKIFLKKKITESVNMQKIHKAFYRK